MAEDQDLFYIIAQLEQLGEVRLVVMHRGARSRERWIGASVRDVEFGGDGILSTVTAHGSTAEETIRELFGQLIAPPEGKYVVRRAFRKDRQALRWDHEFGGWLVFDEERLRA